MRHRGTARVPLLQRGIYIYYPLRRAFYLVRVGFGKAFAPHSERILLRHAVRRPCLPYDSRSHLAVKRYKLVMILSERLRVRAKRKENPRPKRIDRGFWYSRAESNC